MKKERTYIDKVHTWGSIWSVSALAALFFVPLMFSISDVVLINKCDTLSVFDDFSKEDVKERILKLNPKAKIIFVSAKTGEGFEEWADWIRQEVAKFKEK